jgi:hypothetical protein
MIKDQSLFPNSEKQILVNLNVFLVLVNKKKKIVAELGVSINK